MDVEKKSEHHRRPRSLGGKTEPRNLSKVSCKKHVSWHTLFQNMTPEEIAKTINETWLDPDYRMVAHRVYHED